MEKQANSKELLRDFLRNVEGDVKIASTDGTGFFYIGPAAEFLKKGKRFSEDAVENLKKNIAQEEVYFSTQYQLEVVDVMNRIATLFETPDLLISGKGTGKKEDPKIAENLYNKAMKKARELVWMRKYLKNYVGYLDRSVEDSFKAAPAVDDTLVVYVDGSENGPFWMKSEGSGYRVSGFNQGTMGRK